MQQFLLKLLILPVAFLLANLASAEETTTIATTKNDPFFSCSLLTKNISHDIRKVREIAKLQKEKVESCTEYSGDPPKKCTAHLLTFSGLELTVLSLKHEAIPVAATISNPKWNLLGEIKIGQKVEALEKYYGVKMPRNISPVKLMGECAPVVVWHTAGIVTKVYLPCHACD